MPEKHIQAEKDYVKGLKYKDIAEKHSVSINTVKSWKRRYEWTREKGATKEKRVHTKKGAPAGNKNALGNTGGSAPEGNKNAITHGLYETIVADHFSEEDQQLFLLSGQMQGLEQELQLARYKVARLVREQNNKRMIGTGGSKEGPEPYYLQDDFYEDAIQKGIELVSKLEDKLNKLQLEKDKLELSKDKHALDKAKANVDEGEYEDDGFINALGDTVEEVWDDDDNTD
ncbi:terminase gpP N-terminus-related DNA-binding protein [Salibacterium halotolerans]|uniref:Putative ATPase subunit of terminase (GpP-like) n=1 Tax=Salibacterium halotolerans TaxID=1884432 RepID=A0A1I5N9G7_9BACI|nr:hypothetical protein [Salibacterium halotolerans]SFP18340.1 Putative ATPase subunit of terminase (gpP-like) [Salibacterium halotolerans]